MFLLRNMKVLYKIMLLNIFAALVLAVIGFFNYRDLTYMDKQSEAMYKENLQPIVWTNQIYIKDRAYSSLLLEHVISKGSSNALQLISKMNDIQSKKEELLLHYKRQAAGDPAAAALITQYSELSEAYKPLKDHFIELSVASKTKEAYDYYNKELNQKQQEMENVLNELITYNQDKANANHLASQETTRSAIRNTIIVSIGAIAAFLLLGFMISRLIRKPIENMKEQMLKVENWDLTAHGAYASKDEIGLLTTSFNNMVSGLRKFVDTVHNTALTISASSQQFTASAEQSKIAAGQIANSMEQLSSGMENQVRSVDETAQGVQLMKNGVDKIYANTKEIASLTEQAADTSEQGTSSVQAVIGQMGAILASSGTTGAIVHALNERSKAIGDISQFISGIAVQTNLLALNAGIEAARAGDAGRGFAVVAGEVKKLAEQTKSSSEQIQILIESVRKETEEAAEAMDLSIEQVTSGVALAEQASSAFANIHDSVTTVNNKMKEVAQSMTRLVEGGDLIVSAVGQIKSLAHEGAGASQETSAANEEQLATMDEIASSARSLSNLAEELKQLISKMKME